MIWIQLPYSTGYTVLVLERVSYLPEIFSPNVTMPET